MERVLHRVVDFVVVHIASHAVVCCEGVSPIQDSKRCRAVRDLAAWVHRVIAKEEDES